MLSQMRNPDLYHGRGKSNNFFEGWYFKLIDASCSSAYVLIPGINLGVGGRDAHSFVQVFCGISGAYEYISFPAEAFNASADSLSFRVGDNMFSDRSLELKLKGKVFDISGRLDFHDVIRWPDSIWSPGSMGYYNYIPFMECYSQVCAMDLKLSGSLAVNNWTVNFAGGRGYIEKNWGMAFPKGWVWVQCNHFSNSSVSLSVSIGHIPFFTGSFRGFLTGLWADNKFYEFSTMNKSSLDIKRNGGEMTIGAESKRSGRRGEEKSCKLTVSVATGSALFINLKGPLKGSMVPLVDETVQGTVDIKLIEKTYSGCRKGGGRDEFEERVILSDTGRFAGVEFGGEQMLMENSRKYFAKPQKKSY